MEIYKFGVRQYDLGTEFATYMLILEFFYQSLDYLMADSCSLLSKSLTQVIFIFAICLFVVGIEKREVETKIKKKGGGGRGEGWGALKTGWGLEPPYELRSSIFSGKYLGEKNKLLLFLEKGTSIFCFCLI